MPSIHNCIETLSNKPLYGLTNYAKTRSVKHVEAKFAQPNRYTKIANLNTNSEVNLIGT